MSAQDTEKSYSKEDVKAINTVICHIQRVPDLGFKFIKLNKTSLKLKFYSDSAFANNEDNTSQVSFLIL